MSQSISQRRPDANTNTGAGDSRGQPADVLQTFQPANGLRRHQPLNKLGLARTMWTLLVDTMLTIIHVQCSVQCTTVITWSYLTQMTGVVKMVEPGPTITTAITYYSEHHESHSLSYHNKYSGAREEEVFPRLFLLPRTLSQSTVKKFGIFPETELNYWTSVHGLFKLQ